MNYLDDGESHLLGPRAHDDVDGLAAGLAQRGPEVLRERVLVGVAGQVRVHALAEILQEHSHIAF